MWVTEAIPIYITSLAIPPLIVFLKVPTINVHDALTGVLDSNNPWN